MAAAKFLIIRFSSIGDIVLTTPVVRCLKQQVPGAEVHFLTKKSFGEVVKNNPFIDKIHLLESSLSETLYSLKKEKFHYIIDLHSNIRSFIVSKKLNILAFRVNKINIRKWLMVSAKINRLPEKHIVDRYMETLKVFDVVNDNKGLDYFIPEKEKIPVSKLPKEFHDGYIVIAAGAGHNTKKIPVDKIAQIINLSGVPVVLLGGREDRSYGDEVLLNVKTPVYNACGAYSINASASLLENAKAVITPDTGLMHIAAALRKTVLSVWGNTIPQFGMYPYMPGSESEMFEVKNLSCRPCSKLGYKECPQKHFKCMEDIEWERLALNVKDIYFRKL